MESVSLIDKPKAKSAVGVQKVRTTFLPPISKLVAKPGLTAPPPPAGVEPPASACRSGAKVLRLHQPMDRLRKLLAVEEEPKKRHHNQPADHCEGTARSSGEKFPADQRADG